MGVVDEAREGLISAPTPRFKGDWSTLPGPRRRDLWGTEA